MQPDLPLLRWRPPQAEIILFPARLRVGKIRRLAKAMDETTSRHAAALWRQAVNGMRSQMERAGIPEDRIDVEIGDFRDAVQNELMRRSRGQNRINDGEMA